MFDVASIPDLDRAGLRRFGLLFGAIFATIFGLFFPWLADSGWVPWPWIVAGVFWAVALVVPKALNPFYRLWMRVGLVVGKFNTRIILALTFALIFAPVGLVMRLFGKDPMARRRDPDATTYRIPSTAHPRERMERPY